MATEAPETPIKEAVEPFLGRWPELAFAAESDSFLSSDFIRSHPLFRDPERIDEYKTAVELDERLLKLEVVLCRRYFEWFAAHWLIIINKRAEVQTLTLNEPQLLYREKETDSDIILKARKEGMSTYTLAKFFWRALFGKYVQTVVMAHQRESAQELWQKVDLFDKSLPEWLRPHARRDSRRELYYDRGPNGETVEARYLVASSGQREWGRGGDIDQILLSEMAFYGSPETTLAAVLEASREGAITRVETTGNGRNWMYDEWSRAKVGESRFKPFFLPWFSDRTNVKRLTEGQEIIPTAEEQDLMNAHGLSAEQIAWRREKQRDLPTKFGQEYPENDEDPFTIKTGRVYKGFDPGIHVIQPPYPKIQDDWKRYRAVDFGWTNPFVCLWIAVNKDAEVFVYNEIYEREKRTEEHVPLIHARSRGKTFEWTVCDTQADQKADLKAGGIYPVNAMKKYSLEFGFDIIRGMLRVKPNGRSSLFVFSDCYGLITEFLNYAYPESLGETQSENPRKEWDHALDALRYFVVRWAKETGHYWPMAA